MAKPKVFNPELKVGAGSDASAEIQCDDCSHVNFRVEIEPTYSRMDAATVKGFTATPSRRVMFCPFCGGENLSEV